MGYDRGPQANQSTLPKFDRLRKFIVQINFVPNENALGHLHTAQTM
jgi:hypothetical protein